jgi:hypothetical protein
MLSIGLLGDMFYHLHKKGNMFSQRGSEAKILGFIDDQE